MATAVRTPALLLLLLLCSGLLAAEAKVYNINWVHGKRLANINACVGDSVNFTWSRGAQHDLVETKTRTCSKAGGAVLFPVKLSGSKSVRLSAVGTRHFMCSVGLHCPLGQIISVTTKRCSGR